MSIYGQQKAVTACCLDCHVAPCIKTDCQNRLQKCWLTLPKDLFTPHENLGICSQVNDHNARGIKIAFSLVDERFWHHKAQ